MPIFQSTSRIPGFPGFPERSGRGVEIVRELDYSECDIAEVGLMYRIRFCDGIEIDTFADELVESDLKADARGTHARDG